MIKRIYTYLAAALVRAIVAWCTCRKRYVDYVHQGRLYMRRYVIFGYRTGDPPQSKLRARLPNLYLHQMHAPDLDPSLHDHPWPWAVSWIVLGGYREERASFFLDPRVEQVSQACSGTSRWHRAPALNVLRGTTFHRIAALEKRCACCPSGACESDYRRLGSSSVRSDMLGTFTLFLAGPRKRNKSWGYLVAGRGYVHQSERHAEIGAKEVRP